jgi:hypothetical protein
MRNIKSDIVITGSANKKRKSPSMNCGGKKRGCIITVMPHFLIKKAA